MKIMIQQKNKNEVCLSLYLSLFEYTYLSSDYHLIVFSKI